MKDEPVSQDSCIQPKELKKIAKLVKIKLNEEEIDEYTQDLNKVLSWMKIISEARTDHIEPMRYGQSYTQSTPLRKDIVNDGNIKEQILSQTNNKHGYFTVPKVIEN